MVEGEVELYYSKNRRKKLGTTHLKQGEYFGQYSFMTGMPREFTARSFGYTKLAIISRQTFLKILYESEKDYEIYCTSRDNTLLENINFQENLDKK